MSIANAYCILRCAACDTHLKVVHGSCKRTTRYCQGVQLAVLEAVGCGLQEFLTRELSETKKLTAEVMSTIKALAIVEQSNHVNRHLPPEAFYNDLIRLKLPPLPHRVAVLQAR